MNSTRTKLLAVGTVVAVSTLAGCGAFYKTRPHDLTVRGHEEAAAAEDALAKQRTAGAQVMGRGSANVGATVPSHRQLAESHRAAASALREEEAKACMGLPVGGVPSSGFTGVDVVAVDAIREPSPPARRASRGYNPEYLRGAKLTLRGETAPGDVERALTCRIARAAAAGDDGVDPAAVPGASARVRPSGGQSLTVELRAPDEVAAAELLRRARTLALR